MLSTPDGRLAKGTGSLTTTRDLEASDETSGTIVMPAPGDNPAAAGADADTPFTVTECAEGDIGIEFGEGEDRGLLVIDGDTDFECVTGEGDSISTDGALYEIGDPDYLARREVEELHNAAEERFWADNRGLAEETLGAEEFDGLDEEIAASLDVYLLGSGVRVQCAVDIEREFANGEIFYERAVQGRCRRRDGFPRRLRGREVRRRFRRARPGGVHHGPDAIAARSNPHRRGERRDDLRGRAGAGAFRRLRLHRTVNRPELLARDEPDGER